MQKSLSAISESQNKAYGQTEAFELGKPDVALNDVIVDLQKAASPSRWACRFATSLLQPIGK